MLQWSSNLIFLNHNGFESLVKDLGWFYEVSFRLSSNLCFFKVRVALFEDCFVDFFVYWTLGFLLLNWREDDDFLLSFLFWSWGSWSGFLGLWSDVLLLTWEWFYHVEWANWLEGWKANWGSFFAFWGLLTLWSVFVGDYLVELLGNRTNVLGHLSFLFLKGEEESVVVNVWHFIFC